MQYQKSPFLKRRQPRSVLKRKPVNATSLKMSKQQSPFYNINSIIQQFNIKQIHVSYSLQHFKNRVKKKFNLKDYTNKQKPCIFFGVYDMNDINNIRNHQTISYVMPGGSDLPNCKHVVNENVRFISISRNIQARFQAVGENSTLVNFNLVDRNLFKPVSKTGSKIFIYDGFIKKPQNAKIYGKQYHDQVRKKLPQYQYIFSSDLNLPYEKMPDIYAQCFIGLRLTANDGNANMVQEMEAMGIPVVHNFSNYGLKWKNVDDIIKHILDKAPKQKLQERKEREKLEREKQQLEKLEREKQQLEKLEREKQQLEKLEREKQQLEKLEREKQQLEKLEREKQLSEIDMYNLNSLNSKNLITINKNINNFNKSISKFKNILFICGDYPGYGGAATNCSNLQQYYKSKGHQVYGFYYNYERGLNAKYEQNEDYIIDDLDKINKVIFKPDLIILKSPCHLNFKKIFNCPVYYLIGGIYPNSLDKYYYDIKDKKEQDKYINIGVINSIKKSTMAFTNSSHTQEILKKYYNLNTKIFYSSFVPFQNETPIIDCNFENRKYEYGLIVSNFDRKIKNVEKSIEFLKGKNNVILIGKNSEKYKEFGFECVDLVKPAEMKKYYKQIKYIVQDSFYESCSNVKIEGLFNGCEILQKKKFAIISNNYEKNFKLFSGWLNSFNFKKKFVVINILDILNNKYIDCSIYDAILLAPYCLKYLNKKYNYDRICSNLKKCNIKNLYIITSDMHPWSFFNDTEFKHNNLTKKLNLLCPHTTIFDNNKIHNGYIKLKNFCQEFNVKGFLNNYTCSESKFLESYLNIKFYNFNPNYYNFEKYNFNSNQKIYDILISGSLFENVYSLRKRVKELVETYLNDKFNIKIISKVKFNEYLKILNKSWLCLSTCSNYSYNVGKYLEILNCKSVVIGNTNEDNRDILGNNYIHIDDTMSDAEIINVIIDALSNKKLLNDIVNQYKFNNTDFSFSYYKKLENIIHCKNVIKKIDINQFNINKINIKNYRINKNYLKEVYPLYNIKELIILNLYRNYKLSYSYYVEKNKNIIKSLFLSDKFYDNFLNYNNLYFNNLKTINYQHFYDSQIIVIDSKFISNIDKSILNNLLNLKYTILVIYINKNCPEKYNEIKNFMIKYNINKIITDENINLLLDLFNFKIFLFDSTNIEKTFFDIYNQIYLDEKSLILKDYKTNNEVIKLDKNYIYKVIMKTDNDVNLKYDKINLNSKLFSFIIDGDSKNFTIYSNISFKIVYLYLIKINKDYPVYIPNKLKILRDRNEAIDNLSNFYKNSILIAGIQDSLSLEYLTKNDDIIKIITFSGADIDISTDINYKNIKVDTNLYTFFKAKNIYFITRSTFMEESCAKVSLKQMYYPFIFKFKDGIYDTKLTQKGNNILYYCYPGLEGLYYGSELFKKVIKIMPEFNFIKITNPYSYDKKKEKAINENFITARTFDELIQIYKSCFINLRLTKHDGIANMVYELGSLGIKSIYNDKKCPCAIEYKNEHDIKSSILEEFKLKNDQNYIKSVKEKTNLHLKNNLNLKNILYILYE